MGALKYYDETSATWQYVGRGVQGPQGPAGAGSPDATTVSKGSIQLAGDLGGTAASPTVVTAGGKTIVTTTSVQTLTNKTLTSPKVDTLKDTNSNILLQANPQASAVNYITIMNGPTASAPRLSSLGSDTNVGFDINTQGSGRLRVNSVNVPTLTSTDTLTNKTLTSPTITTPTITTPSITTPTISNPTMTGHVTIPSPTSSTDASDKNYVDQLSWQQIVIESLYPLSTTGTWAEATGSGWFRSAWYQSNNTVTTGATLNYRVWLSAGTYTLLTLLRSGTGMGIVAGSLDGTNFMNSNCYSPSNAHIKNTSTGVVVTTDGYHTLSYTCNSKDASSTGYDFGYFFTTIWRTA